MRNDFTVFIHTTDKKSLLQNFISEVEAVTNDVIWHWTNRKSVIDDLCLPIEITVSLLSWKGYSVLTMQWPAANN